jgi:alkylation response protein AidB-like acyl-CoA dehydrogenase
MPVYSDEHRTLMKMLHPSEEGQYSEVLSSLGSLMEKKLLPVSEKLDTGGAGIAGPRRELLEHGMCRISVDPSSGGLGLPFSVYAVAVEMLGYADASTALSVEIHNAVSEGVSLFGSKSQVEAYVPGLASGEKLASFCLTEPGSGSDSRAMATTARKKGDGYVIDGSKMFITNAAEADLLMVFARTEKGPSCFLVPLPNEGVRFGGDLEKLGMRGSRTSEVVFEGCRVPAANLVGEEGKGADYAHRILHGARIVVAALNVGIARLAYEKTVSYSRQRRAFGSPISEFQLIRQKIADMRTSISAGRLLYLYAAGLRDAGRDFSSEAAQAKVFATEMSLKVCDEAIQVHGGYGYTTGDIHRHWRDARLLTIGEGTSEVLRMLIARKELMKSQ